MARKNVPDPAAFLDQLRIALEEIKQRTSFRLSEANHLSDDLTRQYHLEPTAANYVRLRRAHPTTLFSSAVFGGLEEFLGHIQSEVEAIGISPELVMGVMDGDEGCINELSLQLLERMIDRRAGRAFANGHRWQGKQGNAFLDYLIRMMLDSLKWHDLHQFPGDLSILIRERLNGVESRVREKAKVNERTNIAISYAAEMVLRGETPTLFKVSEIMGIEESSVHRWIGKSNLLKEAEKKAEMLRDALKEAGEAESCGKGSGEGAPS